MSGLIPDARLDAQLALLEGTMVYALTGAPAVYADLAALTLASIVINGGHYAKANGDVDGRKNTLSPPAGAVIAANGTCIKIAVATTASSRLEEVWDCPSQLLTAGGTVDFGAIINEIGDPA